MEAQGIWGSKEAQRGWELGQLWNIQGRQMEVSAPSKRCRDISQQNIWDQRKGPRRKLMNELVLGDFN